MTVPVFTGYSVVAQKDSLVIEQASDTTALISVATKLDAPPGMTSQQLEQHYVQVDQQNSPDAAVCDEQPSTLNGAQLKAVFFDICETLTTSSGQSQRWHDLYVAAPLTNPSSGRGAVIYVNLFVSEDDLKQAGSALPQGWPQSVLFKIAAG